MADIILASASPRRRRLMRWLGLPYRVTASDVEDEAGITQGAHPAEIAGQLAVAKARQVAGRDDLAGALVLGFDTIVVIDGAVLGKPLDRRDAARMLELLSGRMHEVVTGVAAVQKDRIDLLTHTTPVLMKKLASGETRAWLEGEEVLGCAGAYNIERHLAEVTLAECFQNVAGLPLCHLRLLLADSFGLSPIRPDGPCNAARGVRCEMALRLLGGDGLQ